MNLQNRNMEHDGDGILISNKQEGTEGLYELVDALF